jgi:hypothetical protein
MLPGARVVLFLSTLVLAADTGTGTGTGTGAGAGTRADRSDCSGCQRTSILDKAQ